MYPAPIFSVSAGLLLRDDIHHALDRLELSFYLKVRLAPAPCLVRQCHVKLISQDGTYYLHFFVLRLQTARELHGKALTADRFRGKLRHYPNPRIIKWHYNQCVKARIRDFAIGMERSECIHESICPNLINLRPSPSSSESPCIAYAPGTKMQHAFI